MCREPRDVDRYTYHTRRVVEYGSEARRSKSAALFNNRHFADCAAHLLRLSNAGAHAEEFVTVRQVAASTQLADSVVRPVVLRLVDAGALERLPRSGGGRSAQYYRVLDARLLKWVALPDQDRTATRHR